MPGTNERDATWKLVSAKTVADYVRERRRAGETVDAVHLLSADHDAVRASFRLYEELNNEDASHDLKVRQVRYICNLLTLHMRLEEEIFYPVVAAAAASPGLVDKAKTEHASIKELLWQIEYAAPSEPLFDARVRTLGADIAQHVKEEEEHLFSESRQGGVDLVLIADRLTDRRYELMAELGIPSDGMEYEA